MQTVEAQKDNQPINQEQQVDNNIQQGNEEQQSQNNTQACVWGIEKFFDQKQCLRFYRKNFETQQQKLGATHIYKPKNKPYFYIRFSTPTDKEVFLMHAKKQRKIRTREATNIEEPTNFVEIESLATIANPRANNRIRQPTEEELETVKNMKIQDVVQPYHSLPYQDQIKQKRQALQKVIQNYNIQFYRDNQVKQILKIDANRFPPLSLTQFVQCLSVPDRTLYRNKTQFTIGYNSEGKVSVGFNKGAFENKTIMIEDPRHVSIVPKRSKMIGALLQNYIRSSKFNLRPFDRVEKDQDRGFWRYLVIRQSQKTNQVLIMVVVANQGTEQQKMLQIQKQLTQMFRKSIIQLKGLCIMHYNGISDSIPIQKPTKILWGDGYYHENILGTNFRISSSAFLQTNTYMCQTLYRKIIDLVADCDIVLDLCCGIGTIGICIKKQNKNIKVIGIEMCAEAVEDAKINDPDYEVVLGRVEEGIKNVVQKYKGLRIVGILDPPRAGMGKDVITALRRCKGLDHIIYVACSPSSIQDNLLGLTLPVTNKRKAPHFVIKQMYGFDLFPQTKHFEALYYMERV